MCTKKSKNNSELTNKGILSQPNKILAVPSQNLIYAGYEDKKVACFDRRTGKVVKEFVAHSDSVTGIQYSLRSSILFTTSHDGSLRSWDTRMFRCINDVNIHRRKYDESILDLKLSPKMDQLASGKTMLLLESRLTLASWG